MPLAALTAGPAMPGGAKPSRPGSKCEAVRLWLLGQISAGTFGRNQQLPSESELMDRFGVSRVTVRRALDGLRHHGLIEGRQGRGYFVRRPRAVHDLGRLQGFGEMMAGLGVAVGSSVLDIAELPAPTEAARALQIERGAPITRISRIRLAGGVAMSYDVSFFPLEIGRRLAGLDLAREDIFKLLETELGIELGFADLRIEVARGSDPDIARHLAVGEHETILKITRVTHDLTGRPIDFEYLHGLADAFQFHLRIPRW